MNRRTLTQYIVARKKVLATLLSLMAAFLIVGNLLPPNPAVEAVCTFGCLGSFWLLIALLLLP